ncbi:MAG TPA: flavodoxin family protein [Terracidiphilus sp.]|nr:flavodoxin family protein [Terracidiphilus sp.]
MSKKIVAIVGSYRKGGTIDKAVEAILAGARTRGARTSTIYLTEQHIEFCTNCRECVQTPGPERGRCAQKDDLEPILTEIEAADAVVLASPVNCYNVTALFRRFLERMLGYAYWPWGQPAPRERTKLRPRKAVLVSSSAMPGFMIPLATGAARTLRLAARMLGAKTVGTLWIGLSAQKSHQPLPANVSVRARRLGMRLA